MMNNMEESDDEQKEERTAFLRLPCDLPAWPHIKDLLSQLISTRTVEEISQILGELRDTTVTDVKAGQDKLALKYFLEDVCGDGERHLIVHHILPFIAALALDLPNLKPYLPVLKAEPGKSDIRIFHSTFVESVSALSFLSLTGSHSLNFNIHSLEPNSVKTHLKIRSYFHHFELVKQENFHRNITFTKEILKEEHISNGFEDIIKSPVKLIPCEILDKFDNEKEEYIRLLYCDENTSEGGISNVNVADDLTVKHPVILIPFLYTKDLMDTESIRVIIPDKGQVSLVKISPHSENKIDILTTLKTFLVSLTPSSTFDENVKSVLRRPSVDAVTSDESELSTSEKNSSKVCLSLSDSCVNNKTDSEQSYNLSEKEVSFGRRHHNRSKVNRKETFQERLKAALERGNTPDDSDDQSVNKQTVKNPINMHKRVVRRQRSTGFRAFNLDRGESDDFFTATDDDYSNMDKSIGTKSYKTSESPLVDQSPSSPIMRRGMVKDKSLDLSTSSYVRQDSGSRPLSSPPTDTSDLYSDSSSFSSEGLGMPRLQSECMEDLCDKLTGVIEVSEGGLEFRNMELKRIVASMPLVRSLSETFLTSIDDLDRLSSLTPGQSGRPPPDRILYPPNSMFLPKRSHSALNLCPKMVSPAQENSLGLKERSLPVLAQPINMDCGSEVQIYFLLLWAAASLLPTELPRIVFNTKEHPDLSESLEIVQTLLERGATVENLISDIVDFVQMTEKERESGMFTFLKYKYE